jgi:hypothetical protein
VIGVPDNSVTAEVFVLLPFLLLAAVHDALATELNRAFYPFGSPSFTIIAHRMSFSILSTPLTFHSTSISLPSMFFSSMSSECVIDLWQVASAASVIIILVCELMIRGRDAEYGMSK